MELSKVFDKNIDAYLDGAPTIINQGGTRSSKSYSIMQLLFLIAFKSKKKMIISIVSRALPHLKLGVMRDFEEILEDYGILPELVKNETNSFFKIGKSIIEFFGADSVDKVHGPARDILYVNEANFIKYDIFDQLAIRTKGAVFLDFNPTSRFWVHDEIIPKHKHALIKSTYLDNDFLTLEQIERIEAKKNNVNWWKVYGLGEIGILEDAVFQNWKYGEFDESLNSMYGLDFGVNDPDAMVRVAIDRKSKLIYVDEAIYQNGLSTGILMALVENATIQNNLIIADSSGKRTIMDMQKAGINIKAVKKYAGSILDGIRLISDYQLIITNKSYNLARELMAYRWVDKKGGVPLDADNHLIDAMRYAVQTMISPIKGRKTRVL